MRGKIWVTSLVWLGLVACGVKGGPTPYVETYPDKPETPPVVAPAKTETPAVETPAAIEPKPAVKPKAKRKKR